MEMVKYMDGVAIKVSGSLVVGENNHINFNFLRELFKVSKTLLDNGLGVGIISGGGPLARHFIEAAKKFGITDARADMVADKAQRLISSLIISACHEYAYPSPIDDLDVAFTALSSKKVVVISGKFPGQTSDNIATQFAGYVNFKKLVKITNVDGVYNADPRSHINAKKFKAMRYDDLIALTAADTRKPGSSTIFDQIAAKGIKNNKITLFIISKNDTKSIPRLINYGSNAGTLVNENGTRDKINSE